MKKWLALAKLLAPIIITSVKPELAPIVGEVTDAIVEAEQIKGATGPQKLEHVTKIAINTAKTINVAKGKEIINVDELSSAINSGITTVVRAINIVNKG